MRREPAPSAVERGWIGTGALPGIEGLNPGHRLVVECEVEDPKVLLDAFRHHGPRDHDVTELQVPSQDDLRGRLAVGGGELRNHRVVEHRAPGNRAPGFRDDAVVGVEPAQLGLLEARM
jgi:hypothetical protein